jgi:hypothetical protein
MVYGQIQKILYNVFMSTPEATPETGAKHLAKGAVAGVFLGFHFG